MEKSITLNEFIIHQQAEFPEATGNFSCLLHHIGIAAKKVNREVNKAGLVDILGRSGCENVQGEEQQKLDVYANEAFMEELKELNVLRSTDETHYLFTRFTFFQMMGTVTEVEDKLVGYMEE